jgi:large subunit ribosomal protein L19e
MNLKKKKQLAMRTFGVGEKRVMFLEPRLDEIKEALTKQDMRDLVKDGAIIIKPIKGKRKQERKKKSRSTGNVRKKVNKRKQEYVAITRKLRKYLFEIESKLTKKEKEDLRKKIRNRFFASKSEFKNYLAGVKK